MSAAGVSPTRAVVNCVLGRWTALNLAVDHSWGGPDSHEKFLWLHDMIEEFLLNNETVYYDELADYIEQMVLAEFNVEFEDNSSEEVARVFTELHQKIKAGLLEEVNAWVAARTRTASRSAVTAQCRGEGDSSGDEADEDDDEQVHSMVSSLHVSGDTASSSSSTTAGPAPTTVEEPAKAGSDVEPEEPEEEGWTRIPKRGKGKNK